MNAMVDAIKEAVDNGVLRELLLEIEAPIQMQARRAKDGQYRTVAVSRGDEFFPAGARVGADGSQIIFEFTPVDPNGEYDQYELNDAKVWGAFPELESLVIRALGFEAKDCDDQPVRFWQIKPKFAERAEELRKKAEAEAKAEEERKKKAAEAKERDHYANHPLYGAWG